jgi:glycosyltransferase involved in cell wall biosynthesis
MRIVYLSGSVIPSRSANSVHVMKMCQAFSKQGHNVLLLVPDGPLCEVNQGNRYQFYGVEECFEIKNLRWFGVRGAGYIYALEAALCARRYGPDLVYGRFVPGCFFSAVLGLPVVYESHFPVRGHGRICEWMFRWLAGAGRLRRLVVVSQALACFYERRYSLPKEWITVAHDGADEAVESGSFEIGDRRRFHVGYVGHLYAGRGIELIVELAEKCRWADFHLVGGADEDVKMWRDRLKDVGNIKIHGFVPPCTTDMYRGACDVLVAPYQRRVAVQGGGDTSEWMSPLKIFEYMAAGKPIVCSDLPVLCEVLAHEKTALLCRPDDPAEWVGALERLRDDADLRMRLGERARGEYMAKYTWRARAEEVLAGL